MSTESPAKNQHLVSIICRTMGRPHLEQALQSIAAQDYPHIEIVLVVASGDNSLDYGSAAGDRPVVLVNSGKALGRSAAANAGLDAASGKYIQFLDDDDWLSPQHVSQLVAALENDAQLGAAYSSTQKANAEGESLDFVFEEDFDPVLLMRDNYIPIHAILFDSVLLEHGCRFDEAFDIYEDWDFWLQLSQHKSFKHIDTITAYYREGGDSDTAVKDVRLRYLADNKLGRARADIFDKWLPFWNGEDVNTLIGQLDQSALLQDQSVLLAEQDAQIHRELARNAKLQHELETRDMRINELDLKVRDQSAHLLDKSAQIADRDAQITDREAQIADREAQIADRDAQIQRELEKYAALSETTQKHSQLQEQHILKLEQSLNAIFDSPTWKLMGPFRRVGRFFSNSKTSGTDHSESDR